MILEKFSSNSDFWSNGFSSQFQWTLICMKYITHCTSLHLCSLATWFLVVYLNYIISFLYQPVSLLTYTSVHTHPYKLCLHFSKYIRLFTHSSTNIYWAPVISQAALAPAKWHVHFSHMIVRWYSHFTDVSIGS